MTLFEHIQKIEKEALASLAKLKRPEQLASWEGRYLGRKGELTKLLKSLGSLSPEEKRTSGAKANATKLHLQQALEKARSQGQNSNTDWAKEAIDITAPGTFQSVGHFHPITLVEHQIEDIFTGMGFTVEDGPEVASEWYNFDSLNVAKDHSARDMQDTFWLKTEETNPKKKFLPRTHTSSVQVDYMEKNKPPFRIIIPGKIFRNEATDASHEHTFHMFECLMVDEGDRVNVGTFKYIAETFFSEFFEKKVGVRLRPSYFPFTEPSFEFDINCVLCDGRGCAVCKQSGWLEIGGAGMVNQKVFEAAGYKRGQYQGFAWGFGLTRLVMMKYKITDIRLFMSGDLRFIRQF